MPLLHGGRLRVLQLDRKNLISWKGRARMKRIPAFAVCGESAEDRESFFERFCVFQRPLRVRFTHGGAEKEPRRGTLLFPEDTPPEVVGRQIAVAISGDACDSLWVDWDDDLPIGRLLAITEEPAFQRVGRLAKIIRCAEGDADLGTLGDPHTGLREQLAQCDLLAVGRSGREEIRRIRKIVSPTQPYIRVIPLQNARGIAAAVGRRETRQPAAALLITVAAAALLLALSHFRFSAPDMVATFLGTFLQALPFLLLGIFLSSVIQVFVPSDLLQRVFPKNLAGGMLFGVLGGFMLPICDCASIPVFRSLVRKGVPLPAAVTFMIAAPIINPVVMLSTYYAFGGNVRIMLTRMGFGILCSVIIGLCFVRDHQKIFLPGAAAPECACCAHHHHSHETGETEGACEDHDGEPCEHTGQRGAKGFGDRIRELTEHFQEEFFEVAPFLLIGIGVSTALQVVLGKQMMNMSFTGLAVSMLAMMAMAFFLSLCSSSDAVVGKNMGASLPMGAVMSFLVFGPMIDVKNMILMASSFNRRFIVKLLAVTLIVSFVTVYVAFSMGLGALIV